MAFVVPTEAFSEAIASAQTNPGAAVNPDDFLHVVLDRRVGVHISSLGPALPGGGPLPPPHWNAWLGSETRQTKCDTIVFAKVGVVCVPSFQPRSSQLHQDSTTLLGSSSGAAALPPHEPQLHLPSPPLSQVAGALVHPNYAGQLPDLIKARCAKRQGPYQQAWTRHEQADPNPLTLTL